MEAFPYHDVETHKENHSNDNNICRNNALKIFSGSFYKIHILPIIRFGVYLLRYLRLLGELSNSIDLDNE